MIDHLHYCHPNYRPNTTNHVSGKEKKKLPMPLSIPTTTEARDSSSTESESTATRRNDKGCELLQSPAGPQESVSPPTPTRKQKHRWSVVLVVASWMGMFRSRITTTLMERMRSRADVIGDMDDMDTDLHLDDTDTADSENHHHRPPSSTADTVDYCAVASSVASPHSPASSPPPFRPSCTSLSDSDSSSTTLTLMIRRTRIAHKRDRVFPLLLIGLSAVLLGGLGNLYVTSSCAMIHIRSSTTTTTTEEDNVESVSSRALYLGLWTYAMPPVERPDETVTLSSSTGSAIVCYPYQKKNSTNDGDDDDDDDDSSNNHYWTLVSPDPPVLAQTAHALALLWGTVALSRVWLYLIFGGDDSEQRSNNHGQNQEDRNDNKHRPRYWPVAIYSAALAGVLQLGTLFLILLGHDSPCNHNQCQYGSAAYASIGTAGLWFAISVLLHRYTPTIITTTNPTSLTTSHASHSPHRLRSNHHHHNTPYPYPPSTYHHAYRPPPYYPPPAPSPTSDHNDHYYYYPTTLQQKEESSACAVLSSSSGIGDDVLLEMRPYFFQPSSSSSSPPFIHTPLQTQPQQEQELITLRPLD